MSSAAPNTAARSGESILFHRNVAFAVGRERQGAREWIIYPPDGPIDDGDRGTVRARAGLGSFRLAIHAAQAAIDHMLSEKADAVAEPSDQ